MEPQQERAERAARERAAQIEAMRVARASHAARLASGEQRPGQHGPDMPTTGTGHATGLQDIRDHDSRHRDGGVPMQRREPDAERVAVDAD